MSVGLEEELSTTIASSTVTRQTFIDGKDFPPDDGVR